MIDSEYDNYRQHWIFGISNLLEICLVRVWHGEELTSNRSSAGFGRDLSLCTSLARLNIVHRDRHAPKLTTSFRCVPGMSALLASRHIFPAVTAGTLDIGIVLSCKGSSCDHSSPINHWKSAKRFPCDIDFSHLECGQCLLWVEPV